MIFSLSLRYQNRSNLRRVLNIFFDKFSLDRNLRNSNWFRIRIRIRIRISVLLFPTLSRDLVILREIVNFCFRGFTLNWALLNYRRFIRNIRVGINILVVINFIVAFNIRLRRGGGCGFIESKQRLQRGILSRNCRSRQKFIFAVR